MQRGFALLAIFSVWKTDRDERFYNVISEVFWSAGPQYSAEERRAMREAEEKCQIQVSVPFKAVAVATTEEMLGPSPDSSPKV